MTRAQKWFLLVTMVLLFAVGLIAQQSFSGGMAVTQSGTWNSRTQDGAGTAITSTASALDINIKSGSIANTAFGINAGTAKIGITYPYTSCGTTAVTAALQALPVSATAVTGVTSCLVTLFLQNTSSSTAFTVTVTDGQVTPVPLLNAVTINPLETREYNFPVGGPKMTTGLKWSASNVAVVGSVEMMQ